MDKGALSRTMVDGTRSGSTAEKLPERCGTQWYLCSLQRPPFMAPSIMSDLLYSGRIFISRALLRTSPSSSPIQILFLSQHRDTSSARYPVLAVEAQSNVDNFSQRP